MRFLFLILLLLICGNAFSVSAFDLSQLKGVEWTKENLLEAMRDASENDYKSKYFLCKKLSELTKDNYYKKRSLFYKRKMNKVDRKNLSPKELFANDPSAWQLTVDDAWGIVVAAGLQDECKKIIAIEKDYENSKWHSKIVCRTSQYIYRNGYSYFSILPRPSEGRASIQRKCISYLGTDKDKCINRPIGPGNPLVWFVDYVFKH